MPQVDKITLNKWNAKNRYGDNRKIKADCGISEHAIGRCIRDGRGAPNTISAINKFYGVTKFKIVKTDIYNDN
jgi:hypothetical protein